MHPAIKPANVFDKIGPKPYKMPGFSFEYLLKFSKAFVPAIWFAIVAPISSSG